MKTGGNLFVGGTEKTAIAGQSNIFDTKDSISTTTGALIVSRGAGLEGSVYVGGNVRTYGEGSIYFKYYFTLL